MILTDSGGLWGKRGNKLALSWSPFWEYAEAVKDYEIAKRSDRPPEGWAEADAPPEECVDGPEFAPHGGREGKGGPSKVRWALRSHLIISLG